MGSAGKAAIKLSGRRNIIKGVIFLVIGLLLTLGSWLITSSTGGSYSIIFTGFIFAGIIFIIRGVTQQFPTKGEIQSAKYKLNEQQFGVEEPEKTWDCPYCKSINPNSTYICLHCGKRL